MRNWYNRKYIVIHEPVFERRGHTFERKLAEAEGKGYKIVGQPTFFPLLLTTHDNIIPAKYYVVYGTVLLRKA